MNLFVVLMYRYPDVYGEKSSECYLGGVTDSLDKAKEIAETEEELRGGKYNSRIFETNLNPSIINTEIDGGLYKEVEVQRKEHNLSSRN